MKPIGRENREKSRRSYDELNLTPRDPRPLLLPFFSLLWPLALHWDERCASRAVAGIQGCSRLGDRENTLRLKIRPFVLPVSFAATAVS